MGIVVNVSLMQAVKEHQKCCMKPLQSLLAVAGTATAHRLRLCPSPLMNHARFLGFHGKRDTAQVYAV